MAARSVTLQVNVAPTDFPHAVAIVPHQLRQWSEQVQEIVFSLDLHRSHRGRFAEQWEERRPLLESLLTDLCRMYPNARVEAVDYSPATVKRVSEEWFGTAEMPVKDFRGGPFYSYFHGLHVATHDLVFHTDSDMLFGGGSQTWVREAVELLERHADILACVPLPGPPRHDGSLGQVAARADYAERAYRFDHLSTRLFLLNRRRLQERLGRLSLTGRLQRRSRVKAAVLRHPPALAPEWILSHAMRRNGMHRIDLLGTDPGVWSLHPPFRSAEFYRELPRLIERVETGDVPAEQRGDYDINDSLFDWSAARRRARMRRFLP